MLTRTLAHALAHKLTHAPTHKLTHTLTHRLTHPSPPHARPQWPYTLHMQARTSTSTPVYFKEQKLALRHSTGATAAGRAAVFGRTAVTPRFDYGDGGGLQVVCGALV